MRDGNLILVTIKIQAHIWGGMTSILKNEQKNKPFLGDKSLQHNEQDNVSFFRNKYITMFPGNYMFETKKRIG